jgi:hypothetical protein
LLTLCKWFLFVLILALTVNINSQFVSQRDFRLKEKKQLFFLKREAELNEVFKPVASPDLRIAAVLSFIVPGAAIGQFYKDEPVNGGIRLGISAVCIIWFLASPPFSITGDGRSSSQKPIALGIYLVNWIASIIDAASSGKKTEKKKPPRGIYDFGNF